MSTIGGTNPELRRGVLLFNLGGPERLEDVRPFLYNLFSDPDIIRIKNDALRKLLAAFIAFARQRKSRALYRQIGGGSPLRKITDDQAAALSRRLAMRGYSAQVYVGMRCWKPTIEGATDRMEADRINQLVVLPLFPQYSMTTTGSCFNYFRSLVARRGMEKRVRIAYIQEWCAEPKYLDAVADLIRAAAVRFHEPDPRTIRLLYSAHSIPERYVTHEGDPYLEQTKRTVNLIDEKLGNAFFSTLAFQSKVGPVRWLGPATNEILKQFGKDGVKKVLAVPISFVSDHIETLQEIDILYRAVAAEAGIKEFHRADSLNLVPKFIEALSDLVVRAFQQTDES